MKKLAHIYPRLEPVVVKEALARLKLERQKWLAKPRKHDGKEPKTVEELLATLTNNLTIEPSGCWKWVRATHKGYGVFRWLKTTRTAHRFIFGLTLKGSMTPKDFVCHDCDNPACCNPGHLYLGDAASNWGDMRRRNRKTWPTGENAPGVKLTLSEAQRIYDLVSSGQLSRRLVSKIFNVSYSCVDDIEKGNTWVSQLTR